MHPDWQASQAVIQKIALANQILVLHEAEFQPVQRPHYHTEL